MPTDLSDKDEKIKWKVGLWNQTVDRYAPQKASLENNMNALFSILFNNISKIMKAKIRSKPDFIKAEQSKDSIWFLKNLEDIILNFEDTKPVILALDDQLETIITLKLGNHSNEDFIKLVSKELKVFEKRGGDFL